MKLNLLITVLGLCFSAFLISPPAVAEVNAEHFETRMHEMELESREIDLQRNRLEIEAMERNIMAQHRDNESKARPGHGDHRGKRCCGFILLIAAIAHILLAVWIHSDARDRGARSGIWIALALLTGFFGAITYAVVRLGDLQNTKTTAKK